RRNEETRSGAVMPSSTLAPDHRGGIVRGRAFDQRTKRVRRLLLELGDRVTHEHTLPSVRAASAFGATLVAMAHTASRAYHSTAPHSPLRRRHRCPSHAVISSAQAPPPPLASRFQTSPRQCRGSSSAIALNRPRLLSRDDR